MKQILLSLFFLMIVQGSLCAQERTYITETDDYIAWQPGVKLTFDMFKNPKPSEKDSVIMAKYGLKAGRYTGFYYILDVPKKARRKGGWKDGLGEKAYFCAMFSKHQSWMSVRDSFELQMSQVIWDIEEWGTRLSRKYLSDMEKQFQEANGGHKSTGVISIFYVDACRHGRKWKKQLMNEFIHNVVFPSDTTKYHEYRKMVDELLADTQDYASTPEEAERFLLNKPVDPRYKKADFTMGDPNLDEDVVRNDSVPNVQVK